MDFKPNIYNISSNYHFFESFLAFCDKNFDKNEEIIIFFPNRRACREFEKMSQNPKIKVKAIADIDTQDFIFFFKQENLQDFLQEIAKIKILSDLDYLFFLSEEVTKTDIFGANIDFSYAMNIAISLKKLFDDIERQEIDITQLYKIDDSNLAKHRQFSLDFLQKFYVKIKNEILKNNIFSSAAMQNFIIGNFANMVEKYGLKSNLIIAGSTGSVNYSKKLISSIAKQSNGYVVLYGFDKNRKFFNNKKDPQFILNDLLSFCGILSKNIKDISQFKLCDEARKDLVLQALLPSEETYLWQDFSAENLWQDLQENICYFEAKNEVEEAQIISFQVFAAQKNNKKIAIITNNTNFVSLIKSELKKFSINFNDTRSLDLKDSSLVNLILLLLKLIENDFESSTLLSILKHPLSHYSQEIEILKNFEIEVLRVQRKVFGLEGIEKKLLFVDEKIRKFFDGFLQDIKTVRSSSELVILSDFLENLILAIEQISVQSFSDLILQEKSAQELTEFFEKLKSKKFKIKKDEIYHFFTQIFSQISYFDKSDSDASVQIISTIEARLLNFDLVIISSLSDGIFPQIEIDNWLGKKIRKDLNIDLSERKFGQNAYDFCNYLSNKSVILTRSITNNQAPLMPSPFILRLEILCKKINFTLKNDEKYFKILKQINPQQECLPKPCEIMVNPPLQYRPKKLAITDIAKLIADPYQIYARKILQLKELNKIDYEAGYREFGSFAHKALEEFIKSDDKENFMKNAQKIFANYFINDDAKLIWFAKFDNILKHFIEENDNIKSLEDIVELPVEMIIGNIKIIGRIDRIAIFANDEIIIFDYKTGQIPSPKNVLCGLEPQLTISALLILEKFKNKRIAQLNYWKLSSTAKSEIKNILQDQEEITIAIEAAKSGLEKLLSYFSDEKNGYKIVQNSKIKHEYLHLERKI